MQSTSLSAPHSGCCSHSTSEEIIITIRNNGWRLWLCARYCFKGFMWINSILSPIPWEVQFPLNQQGNYGRKQLVICLRNSTARFESWKCGSTNTSEKRELVPSSVLAEGQTGSSRQPATSAGAGGDPPCFRDLGTDGSGSSHFPFKLILRLRDTYLHNTSPLLTW